jgi:hypothetical protein
VGLEGGLPFVAIADSDQMIGMAEINLGVVPRLLGALEEVGDVRKGIGVLVSLLRPWKSMQSWSPPSFFRLNNTGAPCGDNEG